MSRRPPRDRCGQRMALVVVSYEGLDRQRDPGRSKVLRRPTQKESTGVHAYRKKSVRNRKKTSRLHSPKKGLGTAPGPRERKLVPPRAR